MKTTSWTEVRYPLTSTARPDEQWILVRLPFWPRLVVGRQLTRITMQASVSLLERQHESRRHILVAVFSSCCTTNRFKLQSWLISFSLPSSSHSALESFSTGRLARHLVAKTLPVYAIMSLWGDWKCGSRKCDTGKIARVENAGVEKAGVDSRGGKCLSKSYGTPTWDYIEKTSSYFVTPTPGTRPVSRPMVCWELRNVENFYFLFDGFP